MGEFHFESDGWHGDRCGCSDDRCIGYHRQDETDCGCLPVLIEEYLKYAGDPAKRWAAYKDWTAEQDGAAQGGHER